MKDKLTIEIDVEEAREVCEKGIYGNLYKLRAALAEYDREHRRDALGFPWRLETSCEDGCWLKTDNDKKWYMSEPIARFIEAGQEMALLLEEITSYGTHSDLQGRIGTVLRKSGWWL